MTIPVISVPGFVSRLLSLLPLAWFSDAAVNPGGLLYAILSGMATLLNQHLGQLQYCALQTRIATATDTNLEAIANDYLGVNSFPRIITATTVESDAAYSMRIQKALGARQNTLAVISAAVTDYVSAMFLFQTALNNDKQGGLNTYGIYDVDLSNPLMTQPPTVQVFDRQSNPTLASSMGLPLGAFCILFSYRRQGMFLNRNYVSRNSYLMDNNPVIGNAFTPTLGGIVDAIRATGCQPIWAYYSQNN